MSLPRTSVVVVSRGRPAHLRLCLAALCLQSHPEFEVILVADPGGLAQRPDLPLKRVGFDQPNISAARNLGLAAAAGEVVAFIDDDATAEPDWLARLTAPFADPAVIAATGWTRDRDGFRWQARGQRLQRDGLATEIPLSADRTHVLPVAEGQPVSTLGTNCAFRAPALRGIGGFDPAFAFHLDESDVNMRLAAVEPQALTAVVPGAQVIHARAASPMRNSAKVPRDMAVQGRSQMLFQRRHAGRTDAPGYAERMRKRLLRQMLDGRLDPLRLRPILGTLQAGMAHGLSMPMPPEPAPLPPAAPPDSAPFMPLPARPAAPVVIGGWHWQKSALLDQVRKARSDGYLPTLILLTPTLLPHRVRLHENGWFEQLGGLWGRSEPEDPPLRRWRIDDRLAREGSLIRSRRNLSF